MILKENSVSLSQDKCLKKLKNVKNTNLSACPHCGSTKYLTFWDGVAGNEEPQGQWCVICDAIIGGCGSSSGYRPSKIQAMALWETRNGK